MSDTLVIGQMRLSTTGNSAILVRDPRFQSQTTKVCEVEVSRGGEVWVQCFDHPLMLERWPIVLFPVSA